MRGESQTPPPCSHDIRTTTTPLIRRPNGDRSLPSHDNPSLLPPFLYASAPFHQSPVHIIERHKGPRTTNSKASSEAPLLTLHHTFHPPLSASFIPRTLSATTFISPEPACPAKGNDCEHRLPDARMRRMVVRGRKYVMALHFHGAFFVLWCVAVLSQSFKT